MGYASSQSGKHECFRLGNSIHAVANRRSLLPGSGDDGRSSSKAPLDVAALLYEAPLYR